MDSSAVAWITRKRLERVCDRVLGVPVMPPCVSRQEAQGQWRRRESLVSVVCKPSGQEIVRPTPRVEPLCVFDWISRFTVCGITRDVSVLNLKASR